MRDPDRRVVVRDEGCDEGKMKALRFHTTSVSGKMQQQPQLLGEENKILTTEKKLSLFFTDVISKTFSRNEL